MRRTGVRAACCAALLLAASTGASAQPLAGVLSLDDALQLAREHSPAFQRVRNDVRPATMQVRAAWAAAFLPSVSTSMGFSGSRSTAVTGLDPYGHPVRLPQSRTQTGSSASQGIGAQVTLFDGLNSWRTLQGRRASLAGTEAGIEAQELQLRAQVSREYFAAVRAARVIALEEALLASARDRLHRTEELLRLAASNRVDVLGARADVAQAEQAVERARGDADKARLSLATTIGIEPTSSLTLDSVLPDVFDPADLDPELLVQRALHGSPQLHQRHAALAAARHSASAARGRRLPSISANAGFNRGMNQPGYGAIGELNPLNYGFSFGFSASLPVFSRFQTSATIAEADAALEDAEQDVRAARLNVERDVRAALIDLEHAYRSLLLAEQNAELSRERQELTQERYRLGAVTFTELQTVIDRTAQAERQALDARFSFITARLNLEEKLGARLED